MRKKFLRIGSLAAMLAVIFGAFGSHALKPLLSEEHLHNFEIGVRYQFYHSLAVVGIGILHYFGKKKALNLAGWFFIAGMVLFCGSLYALAFRDIVAVPVYVFGPLTPIGGALFIAGWIALFSSTFHHHARSSKKGGAISG